MLAILALSLLVFAQTTSAGRSGFDWRTLRELSDLLAAEKRYAVRSVRPSTVVPKPPRTTPVPDPVVTKPKTTPVPEPKCRQEPIELGLIVDSSGSVKPKDYRTGLTFLSDFLDEFDIGPGKQQVRVAAVPFASRVFTKDGFNLNTYKDKMAVQNHVKNMPHRKGGTATAAAIRHMREVEMQNARPKASKVVVVLTDGSSNNAKRTAAEAALTHQAGITVFAVGVGTKINQKELLSIAGGDPDHVFQADSYDDLDDVIKKELMRKTCEVPKPTTTPVPDSRPCGWQFPSDIVFIFSAAAMGLDETASITSTISHVIRHQELKEGFQYGVVSGNCPEDGGFNLGQYKTYDQIQKYLQRYDTNNLPSLLTQAAHERFTLANGARMNAIKIAVIFLGKVKLDMRRLSDAIDEMLVSGVHHVFVSVTNVNVVSSLPSGVKVLQGGPFCQATDLVNYLCPHKKG